MDSLIMALNLYFPDDKSEYIPAAMWVLVFMVGAAVMMWLIMRNSKKEAMKAKELEDRLMKKDESEGNS
ncbi:hypothetical protein D1B31_03220 [Neobacillus notoginsengisoli]|uniref:Uncharacterized protein n=1 Tax=Neobacillus notoginsengisoli TaxID=1578198 RepID=A0A417YXX0_9BACI|nr:hypothetical protein [Neobacillus notoginsengisoli]RHW42618.1 hypothetical protein D1B31_03220 [Neobacillus notoginsengisoli]